MTLSLHLDVITHFKRFLFYFWSNLRCTVQYMYTVQYIGQEDEKYIIWFICLIFASWVGQPYSMVYAPAVHQDHCGRCQIRTRDRCLNSLAPYKWATTKNRLNVIMYDLAYNSAWVLPYWDEMYCILYWVYSLKGKSTVQLYSTVL